MKNGFKHLFLTLGLTLAVVFVGQAATLDISFDSATQAGSPGDTLTFAGTRANNTGSDLSVNGAGINLAGFGPGDSDLTDFILNATGPLPNGSSVGPVDLFTVTIPNAFTPGPYTGTLTVQGGATDTDDAVIGTANFEVDVNGSASGAVPEPGSLVLVGLSLVVTTFIRRCRRRRTGEKPFKFCHIEAG